MQNFNAVEDYDPTLAREEYEARMRKDGFKIVYPKANELQIDIDTEEQREIFQRSFEILQREIPHVRIIDQHFSKKGYPHTHITVQMSFELSVEERIAWQAALGSDPIREVLGLIRNRLGIDKPTLFAEREEEATK